MTRSLCLLLLLIVASNTFPANAQQVHTEDGVLVLTTNNFKRVLDDNEFVLVNFYAPWCGASQALAPEFAKAAQLLASRQSPVKLAKVDATAEPYLDEQFRLRQYPTLKFFRNGVFYEYNSGHQAYDIISWLNEFE
ncbi:protein disulfide-isomerase [Ceratitis capitata]|uniref:protein disulfide-isomerase n=1 Tax=Ceratitis capitata TaxID=7213 RepID=W8BWJ6_CERCA|nr:protein disulfide-isomerase [Ceratitis capitata]CAD6999572.1 unnamed protein product [Ceratitis capitata]